MKFESLLDKLIADTTQTSLQHFSPELAICATIVALLLVRLFNAERWLPSYWVALAGSLVGFILVFEQFMEFKAGTAVAGEYFTGLLVYDQFAVFFRLFLLLFLILVVSLTVICGIPDDEDAPDFYTLLLGSTIGMLLMPGANSLLMLFLAIEMASVPSYVLVGFLKGRKQSSEAALKYVVYGAGAAGVMLYGISLLAGLTGTTNLPELASRISELVSHEGATMSAAAARTLLLGILMVLVGFFFKLSIFPFHFWCPDAFEGAAAEVAGFLSVASKAGAFALLVRFCYALVGPNPAAFADFGVSLGIGLGLIAAATATYGNLAAYTQTNVKRLLAYSTIAHAGYMLMAVSAMLVLLCAPTEVQHNFSEGGSAGAASKAVEGLLFYLFVYLFMNLGAFAIVAIIRNQIFSEEISDYKGLGRHAVLPCVCMGVCMFSLVGIPPFGGFWGKVFIFASVIKATHVHGAMWLVLIAGGANTVFSLFYYIRVLKAMFLEERPEDARKLEPTLGGVSAMYVAAVTIPVVFLGVLPKYLSETAQHVAAVVFN
ncbi:MAG: hypothetical protein CMJ48_02520 [Planctomycetaceae bacterium]|nr:hypothetical protein [Planctomycetaceae bacterium]